MCNLKKCFFSLKAFCGLVFGLHSDFSQDHDYSCPKQGMFLLQFALSSEQKCHSRKKNVHVNVSWFVPSWKALGFQLLSWKVLEKLLNKSESYVLKESSCTFNLRHFIVTSVQISCFECVTQHPTSHEHWCLMTLYV